MLSDERLILLMDRPAQACRKKTEVYSRVCGFFRPVQQWNKGKKEEYKDRKPYRTCEEKSDGHTEADQTHPRR